MLNFCEASIGLCKVRNLIYHIIALPIHTYICGHTDRCNHTSKHSLRFTVIKWHGVNGKRFLTSVFRNH
jgi:hypothetical protein